MSMLGFQAGRRGDPSHDVTDLLSFMVSFPGSETAKAALLSERSIDRLQLADSICRKMVTLRFGIVAG